MDLSPSIPKLGIENPQCHQHRGFLFSCMDYSLLLACCHYSICRNKMQYAFSKKFKAIGRFVTVHIGLRTCCADRRLNWASEQKSHRRRRFSWIFACCCERVNSSAASAPRAAWVANQGVDSLFLVFFSILLFSLNLLLSFQCPLLFFHFYQLYIYLIHLLLEI